MDILEEVKIILDITDYSKDELLNIYIRKSKQMIKQYLNTNETLEEIESNYVDAIEELVVYMYRIKGKENIKSMAQGSRSVTYADVVFPAFVANMLPVPLVILRG
ncbi:phage head-tail connector protein [Clostridium grantii]|uniref:Phage gp6-like head-tail connector protein n=1 Tax=Clostridium grantii DSM 8605 TaxID=1121316 RepID=A0A1M5SCN6_9CLOT|nr:phage head-tail connector protein [Clostridium grantii]SHH36210.1 Phage gp6-like head-tail connector protein [Clostridium grantii DSM 8605]